MACRARRRRRPSHSSSRRRIWRICAGISRTTCSTRRSRRPTIAKGIETRIGDVGAELFRSLFQSSDDARDLWATLRARLDDTDVEVVTPVEEAGSIPWELVRDPKTEAVLALRARTFVRAHPQPAQRPAALEAGTGPIRILLVICRPGGREDVPFRSVASRLLKGLGEAARERLQLDVLRPPTFAQLGRVLREAKADGKPYHVVHFDGHGVHLDAEDTDVLARVLQALRPLLLAGERAGSHGYLVFENPDLEDNTQLVDGPTLGKLLVETDVPVLVLNACRSAHAEAPPTPDSSQAEAPSGAAEAAEDPHARVRAYGSLAHEIMDAGVSGVVAMRYNVYVVTAAKLVAELYAHLASGRTLGQAVSLGRKHLSADPLREIAYQPRPLQDWSVPVVWEAAPIALFPASDTTPPLEIKLDAGEAAAGAGALDARLPKPPDVGFFGRDETLLALDRAFDSQRVVLLHAYAGSGKTTTAAEFARWYSRTGGIAGPVLFTSFEQYRPLARVLDRIGEVFGPSLEQSGIQWLTLEDAERRAVALQVLAQVPVLWIWDNVETIAGFPRGTPSAWSEAEQRELVEFVRDAAGTKAKLLLTSRRDEREWLGDELPRRTRVPPMPMQERVELARALAERHGQRITAVDDWRPLLRFTNGNPLTITVLVGQALRDGRRTQAEVETFVEALRRGEAEFADEAKEGRSKSLGASLAYGFESAFDETERRQLACLHLFQGFVDVDALKVMGDPEQEWCLAELRGLTRQAGIALLDRAAEVGLLTAHGNGYYTIHPALPWFFKGLFDRLAADDSPESRAAHATAAARAFVEAMGGLGSYYHDQYEDGNRDVISVLTAEESNLLHARRLARQHGCWDRVIGTMQGLGQLYDQTGRRAEWRGLVNEIVPNFVDPASDGPRPGRADHWSIVTAYRVRLADQARQWPEAERLQRIRVDWDRAKSAAALAREPDALDDKDRHWIRTLGVSVQTLGAIQRQLGEPECAESFRESLELMERSGDQPGAAVSAFNLGHAYKNVDALRDLEEAERWYRRSLELFDKRDRLGQGGCWGQLGSVAYERFKEAQNSGESETELLRHLNEALAGYQQALELHPENAVDQLAVAHHQLGEIYRSAGDIDRALPHFRQSIAFEESQGNRYGAGQTRFNVALALAGSGRFADAREYARAALRDVESYGAGSSALVEKTKQLIAQIERDLGADPP